MGRVWELLKRPGRKPAITSAAPTQVPQRGSADSIAGYVVFEKKHRLDRWLDRVVKASGSSLTLLFTIGFLFAWGMFGIKYHHEEKWQVILSDVQSIVNYVYDSLLIRQLLNLYSEEMVAMAQVQSRLVSHERMLTVLQQWREEGHEFSDQLQIDVTTMKTPLPQENKFSQFIERAAHFIGHLVCIIGFWVGVVIWLGVGTLDDFSDHWQLCMNTATSGLMVFAFGFLANMRERRASYSKKCFDSIFVVDSVLETKLRSITMDANENETVVIPAPKMNPVQRGIFYYADFVGTLVGIAILICVIIAWLVVGPVMEFDDNWWLLI
ncbi:low-affinity Fe(2+) transport protein, partial [Ascosphaera atra]